MELEDASPSMSKLDALILTILATEFVLVTAPLQLMLMLNLESVNLAQTTASLA
jgi:hypothetical protein